MPENKPHVEDDGTEKPEWAFNASLSKEKPNWADKIPHILYQLDDVFFPLPPGSKSWPHNTSWPYRHGERSNRYRADSETLNGYLSQGWNYGIACANDFIVVDIDDMSVVEGITDSLPKTAYQVTGSREGVHLFYRCEGLNKRKTLRIRTFQVDHKNAEGIQNRTVSKRHIGEIKCDPNGYIVGPGSVHPSGNKYGPLKGDKIAKVGKEELLYAINSYLGGCEREENRKEISYTTSGRSYENTESVEHEFYNLTADDVLPWLGRDERIAHPVHGSTTFEKTGGATGNFMKDSDGETFICWRCQHGSGDGCGLSPQQFLAVERLGQEGKAGAHVCEDVRMNWSVDPTLHYRSWIQAINQNLISYERIPYRVMLGYALENGFIQNGEKLTGEQYFTVLEAIRWTVDVLE